MIKKRAGFTLIELIIVITVIAVLTTMAIPNFYRTRILTRQTVCQNNLRQIEGAVDRWIFENNINEGVAVSSTQEEEIYNYLRGGKPLCPANGTYTIGVTGTSSPVSCDVEGHSLHDE